MTANQLNSCHAGVTALGLGRAENGVVCVCVNPDSFSRSSLKKGREINGTCRELQFSLSLIFPLRKYTSGYINGYIRCL